MNVWITVSHPLVSQAQTIGDIVRLKTIAEALGLLGHRAEIITWRDAGGGDQSQSLPVGGSKDLVKRLLPGMLWNSLKDLYYAWLNREFLELLSRRGDRPDAIIDYNFYLNDAALRFARRHGVPVYLNFEGFIEDSMLGPSRSLLRSLGRRFELRKYRGVDAILPVSKPLCEVLAQQLGRSAPPICLVPNAVRLGAVSVRARTSEPLVGFVGGLSAWYAIDRLIEVCHELRASGQPLRLEIVGEGPERAALDALILRLAAASWCRLIGRVEHALVAEHLARFDVGVITSHKWWTSPLKLLEYGAAALPVVAPRLPSITSMVSPDEAMLFEPGDFVEMRNALLTLLREPERRERLGLQLRRRVESDYTVSAMARRLDAVLAQRVLAA